jgi:hypothetical protein
MNGGESTFNQIPCTEVISKDDKHKITQSKIFSAITMNDAIWKPGDKGTITITFGDYSCDGCSPDASWSQIGKHSSGSYPSMNLGFIDPPYTSFMWNGKTYSAPASATRNYCGGTGNLSCTPGWVPGATVIHEFGHALGMLHEHQNNLQQANPIKINKKQVETYYNCIGMGESGATTNVLDTYSCTPGKNCNYSGTKFDPQSIMLYYLPSAWIQGCKPYKNSACNNVLGATPTCSSNPTQPNFKLSSQDIGWLQHQYPSSSDPPVITVKFIDQNPEPWKVAWVQKIITETYGPLLGIKWNFVTDSILGKTGGVGGSKSTVKRSLLERFADTISDSTTQQCPVSQPSGIINCSGLKDPELLAAVIVPTIGIPLLILFIWYMVYIRKFLKLSQTFVNPLKPQSVNSSILQHLLGNLLPQT